MGAAFTSFFATLISFFSALSKFGKALENIGTVAERTSAAYVDEAEANRELALIEARAKRDQRRRELGLIEGPSA